MTREEATYLLNNLRSVAEGKEDEALDMAIEALSQPIVAKHFDIQSGYIYCSPQDADNVKVVVRCKDCHYLNRKVQLAPKYYLCTKHTNNHAVQLDDYCSWGERKE